MAVFQLGSILKKRREELGYSQEELADGICSVPPIIHIIIENTTFCQQFCENCFRFCGDFPNSGSAGAFFALPLEEKRILW